MQLALTQQMSRGFTSGAQWLRRLITKLASGFNAFGDAINNGKHLMTKHHDLIRRGDLW